VCCWVCCWRRHARSLAAALCHRSSLGRVFSQSLIGIPVDRHCIGGQRGGCAHSLRSRPQCSPFVRAYVSIATRTRARRRCTYEVVDNRSEADAVRPRCRGQSRSAGLTSIEFAASAPAPRFFTLSGHRLCRVAPTPFVTPPVHTSSLFSRSNHAPRTTSSPRQSQTRGSPLCTTQPRSTTSPSR
jgi:hypothetical protein